MMRVPIELWMVLVVAFAGCGSRFQVTPTEGAGWSMLGGNPGRTWQGPDLPLDSRPELLWTQAVNPANEDEVVVCAVADEQHLFVTSWQPSGRSFIICIDLRNGHEVWRLPRTHVGELALAGNQLFVAGNDGAAALACADGRAIWQRGSEWTYLRGLAADTARVYVVSKTITEKGGRKSDEVVVAALSGGNGRTLWRTEPFAEGAYGEPTFAMRPEILLIGSETPTPKGTGVETRVSGLRPEDGALLWQVRLPRVGLFKARSLTGIGGMALTANGAWLQAASKPIGEEDACGYIMLYDLGTQRLQWIERPWLWRNATGTQHGIAADGAHAFIHGDSCGEVRCLDLNTGNQLWQVHLDKETQRVSHPVISGKTVLALTGSGYLHGMKSTSGRRLWSISLGREIRESKSQVLVSDQYVVVCDEATVWVFRPRGR